MVLRSPNFISNALFTDQGSSEPLPSRLHSSDELATGAVHVQSNQVVEEMRDDMGDTWDLNHRSRCY